MIFVDTNYFLRLLLADNLSQHKKAKEFFLEGAEGRKKLFTSLVVIFEIYWVLSTFYKKNKTEITAVMNNILNLGFLKIEDKNILKEAIEIYKKTKLDLEDSYNLAYAKARKASGFETFDQKLVKEFLK